MYALFAAVGTASNRTAATQVEKQWLQENPGLRITTEHRNDVSVVIARPERARLPVRAQLPDGSIVLYVDGYLGTTTGSSAQEQLDHFAAQIASVGLQGALQSITVGSFNAVIVDRTRNEVLVANDAMGLITLHYARYGEGVVLSNQPADLAPFVADQGWNWTAVAEWINFGYTLGTRHVMKGIEVLGPGAVIQWNGKARNVTVVTRPDSFKRVPTTDQPISIDEMAEMFVRCCRNLSDLAPNTATFQSAGLDSRLIAAAWPTPLPSYTYGDPESVEVTIARQVAALRKAPYQYVGLDGTALVPILPILFRTNGISAYPARVAGAEKMFNDGSDFALDGIAGDVIWGGSFYPLHGIHRGPLYKYAAVLNHYPDRKLTDIPLEHLSQLLFAATRVERHGVLPKFFSSDFVAAVNDATPDILAHIATEIQDVAPPDNSLLCTIRNFRLQSKVRRFSGQQGTACRAHVEVLCPFTSDPKMLAATLAIPPELIIFNGRYIPVFRKYFPDFARVASGHSLIRLSRSPRTQHLFETVMTKSGLLDRYAHWRFGAPVKWESWSDLFTRCPDLLAFTEETINKADIASAVLPKTIAAIRKGEAAATGLIFHILPIAMWYGQLRSHRNAAQSAVAASSAT